MALLKEDGSLDIERIDKLPINEYMKEVGSMTQKQYREYCSKQSLKESTNESVKAITLGISLKEELQRGSVNAKDFINNLKKTL